MSEFVENCLEQEAVLAGGERLKPLYCLGRQRFVEKRAPMHERALSFHADLIEAVEPADFDPEGRFHAVRFDLWTTVREARHSLVATSVEGGFLLQLGISVAEGKLGMDLRAVERQEIRRASRIVKKLAIQDFVAREEKVAEGIARLHAQALCETPEEALESVEAIGRTILALAGMEAAVFNLSRLFPNVGEATDEDLPEYLRLNGAPASNWPDTVFLTELTICPRCRNKWREVKALVERHPDVQFRVIFLDKSRAAFKRAVFGDLAPEIVAKGLVVPMAFLVRSGRLVEYLGTPNGQAPPSDEEIEAAMARCFR